MKKAICIFSLIVICYYATAQVQYNYPKNAFNIGVGTSYLFNKGGLYDITGQYFIGTLPFGIYASGFFANSPNNVYAGTNVGILASLHSLLGYRFFNFIIPIGFSYSKNYIYDRGFYFANRNLYGIDFVPELNFRIGSKVILGIKGGLKAYLGANSINLPTLGATIKYNF
ncbi:MAG: hypothetical protein QM528_02895 [Phycisphaerales bacterium]|nr:hypothetical protein [Phycisphaerales bacterium]